jgi:hypothetical protein
MSVLLSGQGLLGKSKLAPLSDGAIVFNSGMDKVNGRITALHNMVGFLGVIIKFDDYEAGFEHDSQFFFCF